MLIQLSSERSLTTMGLPPFITLGSASRLGLLTRLGESGWPWERLEQHLERGVNERTPNLKDVDPTMLKITDIDPDAGLIERRGVETSVIATTGTYLAHSGYPQMQFNTYLPESTLTKDTLPNPALRAFYLRILILGKHIAANPELTQIPSPHFDELDARARADSESLPGMELMDMLQSRGIPLTNFLRGHLRQKDGVYTNVVFLSLQVPFWPFDKNASGHKGQEEHEVDPHLKNHQKDANRKNRTQAVKVLGRALAHF